MLALGERIEYNPALVLKQLGPVQKWPGFPFGFPLKRRTKGYPPTGCGDIARVSALGAWAHRGHKLQDGVGLKTNVVKVGTWVMAASSLTLPRWDLHL